MNTPSWFSVLVLTILLGCTAASPGQGEDRSEGRAAAVAWEYKVVPLTEDFKNVEATFNALSQQGWEFASAMKLRAESPDFAVFKRPRR
jgi:hypothetical protein